MEIFLQGETAKGIYTSLIGNVTNVKTIKLNSTLKFKVTTGIVYSN